MKLAICNETYRDWPWERAFGHARSNGYTGLEIAPFTLGDSLSNVSSAKRTQLRKAADDADLEIVGLHWLLAFTSGIHITSPDKETRARTVKYLCDLSDLCSELGGNVMVLGSPKQRTVAFAVTEKHALDFAASVIDEALPALEKNQVTLAIEPLGTEETNFLNTAKETIEFCKRIGSPNVRLHLDVKAMSTESTPIPEIIRASSPWLAHFHANDPNRKGPGMGELDFKPIVDALNDIGYQDWVSVEVFDESVSVESLVENSARYLFSLA